MKAEKWFLLNICILAAFCLSAQDNAPQYRSDDNDGKEKQYRAPQRFRLGEIVDAGISSQEEPIQHRDKLLPNNFTHKIYAMIRVQLDAGRSISIHDFTIIHNYKAFNCIAIRPVPGEFNAERRFFSAASQPKTYDLLFLLNVPDFNSSITYRCTLHYMFPGTGLIDVDIKFKNFNRDPIRLEMVQITEIPEKD